MAHEYTVNQVDMVGVADAIREKGQTSERLVFPGGFEDAIRAIRTGVELNFEIVGGTSKPSSPKENTIWVNTSTTITGWAFSAEEPASPASGMVWIQVGAGGIEINALKENSIQVCISGAMQYKSGAWEAAEIQIYADGEWRETWNGELYYQGNQYESVTGGWTSTGYSGSVSILSGELGTDRIILNGSNSGLVMLGTANAIDLTDASAVRFVGDCTGTTGIAGVTLIIAKTKHLIDANLATYVQIYTLGAFDKLLDVSALSGSYYVVVWALVSTSCKGYITEVHVE